MVLAVLAMTLFVTDLSAPETVAVVDIALRFETITVDNFFGYTFLQQIIDMASPCIGPNVLIEIRLTCPKR